MVNTLSRHAAGEPLPSADWNKNAQMTEDVTPVSARGRIVGVGPSSPPVELIPPHVDITEPPFNCVADGTTENTTGLQAAFDAAETEGKPIFIPPATSSTLGFLTGTINYKGQSILGTHANLCILKGKPSQDVLHLDPTVTQYSHMYGCWKNFTLRVDDTVDASGSFARSGVGNACFAVDVADGAVANSTMQMIGWEFKQVHFEGSGVISGGRNKSAGIFTQSTTILMSAVDEFSFLNLLYGWWDAQPPTNPGSRTQARDHMHVGTVYFSGCSNAWRLQNWAYGHIADVIMHGSAVSGLTIQGVTTGSRTLTAGVLFDDVMIESAGGGGVETNNQVLALQFRNLNSTGLATATTWNAHESQVNQWSMTITGSPANVLNVVGNRNRFTLRPRGDSLGTYGVNLITDTGAGNQAFVDIYSSTPGAYLRRVESVSRDGRIGHQRDAQSQLYGYLDPPFRSGKDFIVAPLQMTAVSATEGVHFVYTADTTLPFGMYWSRISPSSGATVFAQDNLNGPNGTKVGEFLPKGRVRVSLKTRVGTAGTCTWQLLTAAANRGQIAAAVGTTWQIVTFEADLSAAAIDDTITLQCTSGVTGGGAGPIDIAWIMFRPWAYDWPTFEKTAAADVGDAAKTLTVGTDPEKQRWLVPLAAARAVTLSTTNAYNGARFLITRGAGATGAFNLNIGTGPLKALTAAGQWAEVTYDGAAWYLSSAGTL